MPAKTTVAAILMSACLLGEHGTVDAQEKEPTTIVDAKAEVDKFLGTSDYHQVMQYPVRWSGEMMPDDRKRIVVELSSRLMNTREVPLANYADTFVYSRLQSGKMRFHGHGKPLVQDIFLENGRCAWAIEQMLHCRLPTFSADLGSSDTKLTRVVRDSLLKIIESMAMPAAGPAKAP
jgi:hypothetical protein